MSGSSLTSSDGSSPQSLLRLNNPVTRSTTLPSPALPSYSLVLPGVSLTAMGPAPVATSILTPSLSEV